MSVEISRLDQFNKAWLSQLALEGNAESTLRQCLQMSASSWIGFVDCEIACVWGLVPPSLMSNQAYIWLYTSRVAEAHTFLLVRHSQIMIAEMLKEFPTLVGHCQIDAERSIRWLKWLGAKFGAPTGKGIPFVIRNKNG